MSTHADATPSVPPVGPEVDPTPRPLPARIPHNGASVTLEPLGVRHAEELWQSMQAPGPNGSSDESWAYMGYGPFPDFATFRRFLASFATTHDPIAWAIRPHV